MTRKESGWVSEAMGLIGAYCQECTAQPDANARKQRESLNAINSHLTSMQSAAEGLEEALTGSLTAIDDWLNLYADDLCDPARVKEARSRIDAACGTLAYIAKTQDANRAALAAFQAIKEK